MSRIINRPVEVTIGPDGVPRAFRDRGRFVRISHVLDHWLETGRWWEQEPERETYRVVTAAGGVYELTREIPNGRWFLYKSYD
ncbi:MAG TPA: DUF6504 family protein [Symbiobacteriaceae bacterium]